MALDQLSLSLQYGLDQRNLKRYGLKTAQLEAMQKQGVWLVPTIIVSQDAADAFYEKQRMPSWFMDRVESVSVEHWAMLQEAIRIGVPIALGTDNNTNDLYEVMLDPRMVYTCGYWKNATNLNDAQDAKLEAQEKVVSAHKESHSGELPEQLAPNLATLEQLNVQLRLNSENQISASERRAAPQDLAPQCRLVHGFNRRS